MDYRKLGRKIHYENLARFLAPLGMNVHQWVSLISSLNPDSLRFKLIQNWINGFQLPLVAKNLVNEQQCGFFSL